MFMLRNSAWAMNPVGGFASFFVMIGLMFGIASTDYETNWALKNLMYTGYVGLMATTLVPMIHMYGAAVMYEAALATGVTMGSLGAVAYNAPSQQFLNMGGPLAIGLGGMLGVSMLSMFYPGSAMLTNIWLYGGLGLFGAFVLYDTQKIIEKAKTRNKFDPCWESISIYMDAINLFVRFAMILGNNRKK